MTDLLTPVFVIIFLIAVAVYLTFGVPRDRAERAQREYFIAYCEKKYRAMEPDWSCARAGFPTFNTRVCKQVLDGKVTRTVCNDF